MWGPETHVLVSWCVEWPPERLGSVVTEAHVDALTLLQSSHDIVRTLQVVSAAACRRPWVLPTSCHTAIFFWARQAMQTSSVDVTCVIDATLVLWVRLGLLGVPDHGWPGVVGPVGPVSPVGPGAHTCPHCDACGEWSGGPVHFAAHVNSHDRPLPDPERPSILRAAARDVLLAEDVQYFWDHVEELACGPPVPKHSLDDPTCITCGDELPSRLMEDGTIQWTRVLRVDDTHLACIYHHPAFLGT